MLITMQTMAAMLMTRPIAGPTPLARPMAGRTNGNTTYISRHRNVATISDVWKALRAPAAEPGGASTGSRRTRRTNRSAPERGAGGEEGARRVGRPWWLVSRPVAMRVVTLEVRGAGAH